MPDKLSAGRIRIRHIAPSFSYRPDVQSAACAALSNGRSLRVMLCDEDRFNSERNDSVNRG
jgi:hypothetical protein